MYAFAYGEALQRRYGYMSVRQQHRNGHAFENILRRTAQKRFAQAQMAIGAHNDHVGIQISRFREQQIADRHVARYRPDGLRPAAVPGNLIEKFETGNLVRLARIDAQHRDQFRPF